jgi:uncharacterized protein YkwD
MRVASLLDWVKSLNPTSVKLRIRRSLLSLETLEAREVPALNPSGFEQEMLELTNKMRMDPAGELNRLLVSTNPLQARDAEVQAALTYFGVSGSTLVSQWSSLTPAAPLAWSELLTNAARGHNTAMIAADTQSHQLPGEPALTTRATNAGYTTWSALGENIYAYSDTVLYGHAGFAIDWGYGPGGIQSPAGHRVNIMNKSYREVGISVVAESNSSTQVGPLVITQDFGSRSSFGNPWLLGVVYGDTNSNGRYNNGEGKGGVSVTISGSGNYFTTTMTAGGYQIQVPAGSYTVTFSGGGLASPISKSVTVGSANVKVDGIAGQSGSGGTPPPSNTAPVLNASYVATLTNISKNNTSSTGNTVASIVGNSITDVNTTNQLGIAVYSASSSSGQWQYSTNNGSTWSSLAGSTGTAARLLRMTDRVRFVPNSNYVGTVSFSYRAWDGTSGTAGGTASQSTTGGSTAFSTATDSATLSVLAVNSAPVLSTTATYQLSTVAYNATTPPAVQVGTLIANKVTDADANALKGIAITALDSSKGTWKYSLNGTTWYTLSSATNTGALLLRSTDYLRYYPKAGTTGPSSFVFRAWDLTTGTAGTLANASSGGGSSSYSADQVFAWVQVGNTAPVLNTSSGFSMNNYQTGTSNSGSLVSTLLGYSVYDGDLNAKYGVAITGLAGTTTGTWQYSTNGGSTWTNMGTLSNSSARLLRSQDRIRYVPNAGFKGTVSLSFRAWDQTSGLVANLVNLSTTTSYGGRTAYSSAIGTGTLKVV